MKYCEKYLHSYGCTFHQLDAETVLRFDSHLLHCRYRREPRMPWNRFQHGSLNKVFSTIVESRVDSTSACTKGPRSGVAVAGTRPVDAGKRRGRGTSVVRGAYKDQKLQIRAPQNLWPKEKERSHIWEKVRLSNGPEKAQLEELGNTTRLSICSCDSLPRTSCSALIRRLGSLTRSKPRCCICFQFGYPMRSGRDKVTECWRSLSCIRGRLKNIKDDEHVQSTNGLKI